MVRVLAMMAVLFGALGAGGCAPDGDRLVGRLQRFKDEMCACKDPRCIERVTATVADWSLQHAQEMSKVRASEGARSIVAELGRCQGL